VNPAHPWLIVGVRAASRTHHKNLRRELHVKSSLLKTGGVKSGREHMPIHRRRFRIEEAFVGEVSTPSIVEADAGPMHHEIMTELRAIRSQMASPAHGNSAAA
jgi:hypothetical protein